MDPHKAPDPGKNLYADPDLDPDPRSFEVSKRPVKYFFQVLHDTNIQYNQDVTSVGKIKLRSILK